MTFNRLLSLALDPILVTLRRYYLQSLLNTHYHHLDSIKQQRADGYLAERYVTREIVTLESELRDL